MVKVTRVAPEGGAVTVDEYGSATGFNFVDGVVFIENGTEVLAAIPQQWVVKVERS